MCVLYTRVMKNSLFDVVNANEVVCNGDGGAYERHSAGSDKPLPDCPGAAPELVERGPYAYNKVLYGHCAWLGLPWHCSVYVEKDRPLLPMFILLLPLTYWHYLVDIMTTPVGYSITCYDYTILTPPDPYRFTFAKHHPVVASLRRGVVIRRLAAQL